jgi:hypothetical protein
MAHEGRAYGRRRFEPTRPDRDGAPVDLDAAAAASALETLRDGESVRVLLPGAVGRGRQSLHEVCPDGTMEYRNNYTLLANLPSLNIHAIVGSFSFVFKQRGASIPKSFTKTLFRFNMPHPPNIETNTIKIQISIPKEEQVYVNTLEPPVIVDKKWEKEKMNPLEDAILEVTGLRVYRITEPPAQLPTLKVIPKSDKGKTK